MKKFKLFLTIALLVPALGFAQNKEKTVTFYFLPESDGFWAAVNNNDQELKNLVSFVKEYHSEIRSGKAPVHVNGYCSAFETEAANLASARIRSNRVKSELIVRGGLIENDFRTQNHASAYNGKSVVMVSITIPGEQPKPQPKPEPRPEPKPEPKPEVKPEPKPAVVEEVTVVEEVVTPIVEQPRKIENKSWREPYSFALRTNLLYWAVLTPNIGIEWRAAKCFGVKVDGGWSGWSWNDGKTQHKIWYINPELRWYMGNAKRFYVGASYNYFDADMRWDPVHWIIGKNYRNGYDGTGWNAGITVGYQARLAERLSMDFNLGFGYNEFKYRAYRIDGNGDHQYMSSENVTKSMWFLTQAEVALVWRFGRN